MKNTTKLLVGSARFAASAALLLAGACKKEPPPRSVRLELPESITSRDATRVVVHIRDPSGRLTTSREELDFEVGPPDLAEVSAEGFFRCLRSGDGKVSVSIAGVTGQTDVRCRVVDKLEVEDVGRVDVADGAFEPKVRAMDPSGKELSDVSIQLSPKIPSVVKSKGASLIPTSVGATEVVATAGASRATFQVEVVKKLPMDGLPIEGGRRVDLSLDPGRYELSVELAEPRPMTVRWRAATFCNAESPPKPQHTFACNLQEPGGVSFDNPGWLSHGKAELQLEGASLTQVP